MTFEAGLIASRFLHLAAQLVLFGAALFPLYSFPQGGPASPQLSRRLSAWVLIAAAAAFASGVPWFLCTVANMAGAWSAATDWATVRSVLLDSAFGHLWVARLSLSGVVVAVAANRWGFRRAFASPGTSDRMILILAAALLVGLAGTGHTQIHEGTVRLVQMGADGAHLLAAGAWLGGLCSLGSVLARCRSRLTRDEVSASVDVLNRFSGMGMIAVAMLVGSGLLNTWFLVGSLNALVDTSYGRLLLVKLGVFATMVVLATANRFWLLPALARNTCVGGTDGRLSRLRLHVLGEQVLGVFVIVIVSILGTMDPAANN